MKLINLFSDIELEPTKIPTDYYIGQYSFTIPWLYELYSNSDNEKIALKKYIQLRNEVYVVFKGLAPFSIRNPKYAKYNGDIDWFGSSKERESKCLDFILKYSLKKIKNKVLKEIITDVKKSRNCSDILSLENEFPLYINFIDSIISKLKIRCNINLDDESNQELSIPKLNWKSTIGDFAILFHKLYQLKLIESPKNLNLSLCDHFTINGRKLTSKNVADAHYNFSRNRSAYKVSDKLKCLRFD